MNCLICGGILKYIDGLYVCESCGAKQSVASIFEKTEVFICYIENDNQGRRSKDSVIAQDLYNQLEIAKINTFYQRISAADLMGTEFENACTKARNEAKIVIIVGSSIDSFEKLLEQYKDSFNSKKILPVYSEIDAYDLPKEYRNLQALNYDNIGASNDLIKAVLYELRRENEVDIISEAEITKQKKKRNILLSSAISAILIMSVVIYMVFGTPYILKSKKYTYAEKLAESGKYIDAIELYSSLDNYEDSKGKLNSIYDRYNGYFINEEETLCLYVNIEDTLKAEIEIIRVIEEKMIRANTSTTFKQSGVEFSFLDSNNTSGTGKILLHNNEIQLITSVDNLENLSIGNIDILFDINNKADAPISAPLTEDELLSWLKNKTTEQDVYQKGYELEPLSDGLGVNNTGIEICNIKNTNIQVLLFPFDTEKVDYDIDKYDQVKVNNKIVVGISAPADIFTTSVNDHLNDQYIKNDLFYIKDHNFYSGIGITISFAENTEKDPVISIVSKKRMFKSNWDLLVNLYFSSKVESLLESDNPNENYFAFYATENETDLLICADSSKNHELVSYYKVNKLSGQITYIGKIVDNSNNHSLSGKWKQYPEMFGEFL